jgi:hypothetical protein
MRDRTKLEEAVTRWFRDLTVGGPFSVPELANGEASVLSLEKAQRGDTNLSVAKLIATLRVGMRQDPDAVLDALTRLLRLVNPGLAVCREPEAGAVEGAATALVVAGAEAGAAVGAVQAAVLRAAADGHVSPDEAAEIAGVSRQAERELADVELLANRIEQRAQPSLALGSGVR